MNFNKHSNLLGTHAFLSASKYHWINYSDDKLVTTYKNHLARIRGDRLHDFARECIELGVKLPRSKKTLNMYVNDAIGFKMTPEQPLYFSDNCYGTADAVSFRKNLLRIHDLKTGVTQTKMEQLEVYAALFCLEYEKDPNDIQIELRIYQLDDIWIEDPNKEDILYIMEKIKEFDRFIEQIKTQEDFS